MKMKITYGCYPSIFSRLIANILVEKYKLPVKTILLSTKTLHIDKVPIAGIKGFKYAFKRFGFRFIFYETIASAFATTALSVSYLLKGNKFYSFEKLCEKNNIQLVKCENFNTPEVIEKVKDSDYFLSMCLDQILKKEFITSVKGLCVNIHPSDLPDFKGVDSVFQFLLSNEKKMGVTLHEMTPVIDTGNILDKNFIPRNNRTHFGLMKEFVITGTKMFYDFITNNKNNEPILAKKEITYPYKSWATRDEINEFYSVSRFYNTKDLLNWKTFSKTEVPVEETH